MESPRVRLGELLVRAGLIASSQLEEALAEQARSGGRLGAVLVESGLVSETQVTQILSQQLSVPWVSLHHIEFSRQLLDLVTVDLVERFCLIPIYVRRVRGLGDALYVAMDDPTNAQALVDVAECSGLHVRAMIAPPSDIRAAIHAYYGVGPPPKAKEESSPVAARAPMPSSTGERPKPPAKPSPYAGGGARPGSPEPPPKSEPASMSPRAPQKPGRKLISMTLLDGTTIQLPAKGHAAEEGGNESSAPPSPSGAPDQLTARDLVAALRAASHGADASEVLGAEGQWERMFAALLSVMLKKHIIADWEFVEEFRKG